MLCGGYVWLRTARTTSKRDTLLLDRQYDVRSAVWKHILAALARGVT